VAGTLSFGIAWIAAWAASGIGPWLIAAPAARRLSWFFPALGLALLFIFRHEPPVLRLLASSLLFLYLMKGAVLMRSNQPPLAAVDRILFATVWPGMDDESFVIQAPASNESGARFGRGLTLTLLGMAAIGGLALAFPHLSSVLVGWLGIAAILLTIHFGLSDILTALLRLTGRPVQPLFDRPLASRSLFEFWTRRWNLAFVEMDRRLFLPPLVRWVGLRRAVPGVFLISGLLHEMAISYPAGAGWGGPFLYFALQYAGVAAERRAKIRSRLWTLAWVLLPLPLLFHAPFRETLIVPLFAWLHGLIASRPAEWFVSLVLWTLGPMQLSVLMASYQVPRRLNWHEELPRLSPFNRKLMWTYGLFIVASVIAFAILTMVLHGSFMEGERAAIGLAGFMCGFWCLRLAFDAFYYSSDDWPEGVEFRVGHALLNALFVYLALGYGTAAVWGWLRLRGSV
jgi:alginate O-acetyltransferase complex protein AlgI